MVMDGIEGRRAKKRPRVRYETTRIYYAADRPPSFLAMWTSRLAVFALVAGVVAVVLHRLHLLPTAVAITIAMLVIAGAALSLVMAGIAGLDIWMTGRQGAARVFCGVLVALGLLGVPAALWVKSFNSPALSDVSTDTAEPPEFTEAADERTADANPVAYPGEAAAALQRQSYPDLKTLVIPRAEEEAYELVLQALAKLKIKPTLELAPEDDDSAPGFIEASEHSMILGLIDDVVIRVDGDDKSSRIDVRSASRYGTIDFGRNAENVRAILKEVASRFESSVPDADKEARAAAKAEKAKLKAEKGHDRASKADRRRPDPSRSGIRHGLGQKASPQAGAGGRGPGKRAGQFDE